jgi:hypothetical protein
MGANYAACRYSVTVRTDDIAVLHMLRGLSQLCESGTYPQIAWGGTGADDWRRNGKEVTFRFTAPTDRNAFMAHGRRLLPGAWTMVATNDNDPATPRR